MIKELVIAARSKRRRFLFRSSLIGTCLLLLGILVFDSNRSAPDYVPSLVFGLLMLPIELIRFGMAFVLMLAFMFQPLLSWVSAGQRAANADILCAATAVAVLIGFIAFLIDGSTTGQVLATVFAVKVACWIYAKKNLDD